MSRIHPQKSKNYTKKKIIRKKRERHRHALFKAKQMILKINGYSLQVLLDQGKNGKMRIKKLLKENKREFRIILKDIKLKEGLV